LLSFIKHLLKICKSYPIAVVIQGKTAHRAAPRPFSLKGEQTELLEDEEIYNALQKEMGEELQKILSRIKRSI
jgi:hypothetical protein